MCWPFFYLCCPFCIFERCLDSNSESCRSKQARYQRYNQNETKNFIPEITSLEENNYRYGTHKEKKHLKTVKIYFKIHLSVKKQ